MTDDLPRREFTAPNGVKLVSTPDTLGGAWRIDGHRLSTELLADLARAEGARHNSLIAGVRATAESYEITEEEVWAAVWFEEHYGDTARFRDAVNNLKAVLWEQVIMPIAGPPVNFIERTVRRWFG